MNIPRELDYEAAADLPSVSLGAYTIENNINPLGTNSYPITTSGNVCTFDLPARGFMDPSTLFIRYKMTFSSNGVTQQRGTPVYAPIQRCDIMVGSTVVESLLNYNQYMNMKVNTTYNNSQKYSVASAFGYRNKNNMVASSSLDGRYNDPGPQSYSMAAPLDCALSNSKEFIPICFLSNLRISLTFDSTQNIFCVAAGIAENVSTSTLATDGTVLPADVVISDVCLSYTTAHFPLEVEAKMKALYGDKLTLRTQSYMIGSAMVPKSTIGQIDLQYNQRLSSIRSVIVAISCNSTINGIFDALDITQSNGEYSLAIAGRNLNKPYSTNLTGGKGAMLLELRKCISTLYSRDANMSINNAEWNASLTAPVNLCTTAIDSGKFYIGFKCNILSANSVLLSGQSCQDAPLSLRIVCQTATAETATVNLISVYDMIIVVDCNTKTCSTKV